MRRAVAAPLLVAAAALACARPGVPPGGEVDRIPPRVLEVFPAPFDTLTDPDAPVVVRFDERLSERFAGVQQLSDAVLVSPSTSPVTAERNRRSIEISLVRGWQPGLVYRVVIQPVFSDLFNNQRREPVDLVFSTGAPIPETAVAGFVQDGLTLEPVPDVRIEATRRIDATTYLAVTDTAGFFALRYMPAGAYDLRAWLDQDRDREPDFFEPQDSTQLAMGFQDTTVIELAVLPGDTTPANLARAEAIDSTKIRLTFDDHFPPGEVAGTARLYDVADDRLVAELPLWHGSRLDSLRAAEQAAADSAAAEAARQAEADSLAADTLAVDTLLLDTLGAEPEAIDTAAAPPGRPRPVAPPRAQLPTGRTGPPLPSRELFVVLPAPMRPGAEYRVEVVGVTNIQGVPGGGGSDDFTAPEPPPAAEATPDTANVPGATPGSAGRPR